MRKAFRAGGCSVAWPGTQEIAVYTLLIISKLANGQIYTPKELYIYPSENACSSAKTRNDTALIIAQAYGAKTIASQCVPLQKNSAEYCRQWPQDCR
jgi:hypothetical protein